MKKNNCPYCGSEFQTEDKSGSCPHCHAPRSSKERPEIDIRFDERAAPFFLNGLIVYPIRDLLGDMVDYYFYQGSEFKIRLSFGRDLLRQWANDKFWGTDPDQFFWKMYQISQGETDAISVIIRNPDPEMFFISRLELRTLERPRIEHLGEGMDPEKKRKIEALIEQEFGIHAEIV